MAVVEESIPTIDLSLADAPSSRHKLLQQLRRALLEVGFLYVSDHGIKQSVVNNLVEMLPNLFALPVMPHSQYHLDCEMLGNSPTFPSLERKAKQKEIDPW